MIALYLYYGYGTCFNNFYPLVKLPFLPQLLSLWESKINLEDVVLLQLKNPVESWGAFEKGLIDEFPQVVATINQHIDATFEVSTFYFFSCMVINGQFSCIEKNDGSKE